jgi:hypothetical protein
MKLSQAAKKPQLTQLELKDQHTIDTYGEPLQFWILDPQPMSVYGDLVNLRDGDVARIIEVVRNLVLDETGEPMIAPDQTLPQRTLLSVVELVMSRLGE